MRQQGMKRAVWTVLGIAAAVLLVGCEGATSPTEPVAIEAEVQSFDDPVVVGSGGPGEVPGCVPGRMFPMMDDGGELHWFLPPPSACTTKIAHERRTMTVELDLPPGMPLPSRNVTLDFANTNWRCPMPGPTWDPVCVTEQWTFRVKTDGRYSGTCHIHDF